MTIVHRLQQIQHPALVCRIEMFVIQMTDDLPGVDLRIVDVGSLINSRQKTIAPQRRSDDRLAGAKDDKARQVLVIAPQSIRQP